MKNKLTLLKMGLVGLFLMAAVVANGQIIPTPSSTISSPTDLQVGTIEDGVGAIAPTDPPAVFFYRSDGTGTSITLQASLTDASATPLTFTSYVWYEVTTTDGVSDDVPTTPLSETTRNLVLENLQPGYHKYRVYGLIEDGTASCQSEEFQDIVFFVLRPLSPTASAATGAITEFCLDNPPATALELTANVAFDDPNYVGNYANPDVDAFDLTYRWYAIKDGETATQIDLPENVVTEDGGTHTLSISDYTALLEAGNYTFYVEVQYSNGIKDRVGRTHAIWSTQVLADGSTDAFELTVTPIPGRPTITIEGIND